MSIPASFSRPTWAEINLDNLTFNLQEVRHAVGKKTKIMAVVKADAYGHGAVEVSRTVLENGADALGVAFVEEAIELRHSGIAAPILILGFIPPDQAAAIIDYDLTPTVFIWETAQALSHQAFLARRKLKVHIKIDTGMGRIGVFYKDAPGFINQIAHLPGLEIEGLFTHFAKADEGDNSYTLMQLNNFFHVIRQCHDMGFQIPITHAANSAAIALPEAHLDMVRIGIALYGYRPSAGINPSIKLKPVMSFKTRIIFIKKVPPGSSISYGGTYCTTKETTIATIPVGYGDGYSRNLSNRGHVLVGGCRVPVVGRICMDHAMLEINEEAGVKAREGDEVVLYGRQGGEMISADEIAASLNTINYEVLCAVGKRVPRLYYRGGKNVFVKNNIPESKNLAYSAQTIKNTDI